jgi:hypothetical protein
MKSTGMGMSMEKMMGRMFKRVDTVVWDLMSGKLGVRNSDGEIVTFEGEGDDARLTINPFEDFGVALPAFAQSTPFDSVKVGDLIYTNGDTPGWITEIKVTPKTKTSDGGKKSFRLMRASGSVTTWIPPKVSMFGLESGVLVVRSLMTMLPGGESGLAGLQGMIMPMILMGGGEDGNIEKMLPLMLMMQMGNGGAAGANPMGGMMQTMMMMKMMGGDTGGFGNMFGGSSTKSPFKG